MTLTFAFLFFLVSVPLGVESGIEADSRDGASVPMNQTIYSNAEENVTNAVEGEGRVAQFYGDFLSNILFVTLYWAFAAASAIGHVVFVVKTQSLLVARVLVAAFVLGSTAWYQATRIEEGGE